jgi:hypothetical protein
MKDFVICGWAATAVIALSAAIVSQSALAQSEQSQKGSLALPLPAPVPAPSSTPAQTAPMADTHARSAHHALKLELPSAPKTEADTGNSPLQGAGPPQGNPPTATASQGAGPLTLSPLQGAGPMTAREMLLGSASTLGTR